MTGAPRLSWPRPPLASAHPEPLLTEAAHRRLAFASARMRDVWEPRLASLSGAAVATELRLVATGALDAGLIWCPYDALAEFTGRLIALHLEWKAGPPALRAIAPPGPSAEAPDLLTQLSYPLIVSRPGSGAGAAIDLDGSTEAARTYGYPPCCAAAWAEARASGRSDPLAWLLADPAWADRPLTTGVMLGALGLGPVRHMPCGPNCAPSRGMARMFLETMASLGLTAEAGWLAEMMQWRVRASLAGGVAEVETGAFRFAWHSGEASAPPMTSGNGTPEGAPTGLSSIFAEPSVPARAAAVRPSAGAAGAGEDYLRAGFASPFAHRSRLSAIVWEQSKLLRKARTVLHPGCGTGLLLELIEQSHPSLRVCGIEADAALAAQARARLRKDRSMIVEADWIAELDGWGGDRGSFDLALVDPEPLIALSPNEREAAVAGLAGAARSIVLIATDRALERFGTLEAMAATLGFAPVPGRDRRISCLLASTEPAVVMA